MIKVRVACGPVFTQSIDVAPAALLAGALDIEETTPDAAGFEGAPASALRSVEKFLRISRDEMRAERDAVDRWLWNDAMRAGHDCAEPVAGVASAGIAERDGKGERDVSTATTVTGGASHLQKKVDVAEGGGVGRRLLRAFGVGGAGGGDGGGGRRGARLRRRRRAARTRPRFDRGGVTGG